MVDVVYMKSSERSAVPAAALAQLGETPFPRMADAEVNAAIYQRLCWLMTAKESQVDPVLFESVRGGVPETLLRS